MTFRELYTAIGKLSVAQLDSPAVVYPPPLCPSIATVPVSEVLVEASGTVVILTGKKP